MKFAFSLLGDVAKERCQMRYMLNAGFTFQGEEYWRVDDMDRMFQEEKDGTYNAVAHLRRFGIAINKHKVSADQARAIVEHVNALFAAEASVEQSKPDVTG